MQLPLDDPRTDQLRRLQAALIARYGRIIRPSEKRRDPMWTLVQGVIGAQTKTAISNASADLLLAKFGSWEAVAGLSVEALEELLSPQTFPAVAAQRLKACLAQIIAMRGAADLRHLSNLPTEQAMEWLETLPGIARKNAAGIMNASTFDRRAMVIDGHHRRTMQRIGLVPPKADTARAYDALMPIVPEEWSAADYDEHHQLLKALGQTVCRPSAMHCEKCPVRSDCATGKQRA